VKLLIFSEGVNFMINDSIEYLIEKSFEEFEEKMESKGMLITDFNDIINEIRDKIKTK